MNTTTEGAGLDVLLINPPLRWAQGGEPDGGEDPLSYDQPPIHFPPLGLCYLGAVLLEDGFTVELLDGYIEGLGLDELLAEVTRRRPRLVGISALCFTLPVVYSLVQALKKARPDLPVVLGNMQVADDPELVSKTGADFGLLGWAEYSLRDLARWLLRSEGGRQKIAGLVHADDQGPGRPSTTAVTPARRLEDLDALPHPARQLLADDVYFSPADARPMTAVTAGRGCTFGCFHCQHSNPVTQRHFYPAARSVEQILREVHDVERSSDVRYFEFTDNTFTTDRERVLSFCQGMIAAGSRLEWSCDSRANLLDRELLLAMRDAGCKKISIGVETASESARWQMNKKITNQQIRRAFSLCRQLGIETTANFIFGLPSETAADLQRSTEFAVALRPNYVEFHIALVVPNTPLFHDAVSRGLVPADVFDRYMYGEVGFPVFVPEGLKLEQLRRMDLQAYRRFYLRPGYVLERLRRLQGPADLMRHIKLALWVLSSAGKKSR